MKRRANLKTYLAIAVFLVVLVAPATAAGEVIYVDADAAGDANGASWADAYNYLQDALAVAVTADEIWVAEGTYKPTTGSSRTVTFQLKNGVGIYGGFAGSESTLEERDWQTNETILSGDIGTVANNSDNSYHVVRGSGTNATAVLDGFTITAGNANGSFPYNTGGGMYNNSGGSPTVTNCNFSGNSVSYYGGGMYNHSSSPTVTNCNFSGNSTGQWGGGMFNGNNSSPTVTNCTFSGNSAVSSGGGMYSRNSTSPMVTNCTFAGNSATNGNALASDSIQQSYPSNIRLANCILWDGGVEIWNNDASTITITYSDIAGGYGGTGNKNTDPCFVDADGPDNTAGTEDDDLHLLGYSPCINTGDPSYVAGPNDIDNQPRVLYGRVDMGADEVFPIAGDFDQDEDVDMVDFAYFANNWLFGAE